MSIFNQTSAFGGTPSAFGADHACSCRGTAAASRDLLCTRVSQTQLVADTTASSPSRAASMPWEGNAASLFRQRLNDCAIDARRVVDDAESTLRIAQAGA
ncbi:hypothetical protein JS533_003420 [Bifidobacterium amazonense]|uniref:Uncharacterized protein n=1 Tax=Bifidobacterium amazonense TaxID=2809027 RepID=A0ABS9VTB1_9BIFI|nr:hypothetical protein [Bifidobacterium amazonense]MCH9275326.1 hypothetical protein [Bifidobacterium amazonense]